jgi:hypothetical protein
MEDQLVSLKLSEDHNWWWIGFRFGMGLGAAAFIFFLLGALACHLWQRHEANATNEAFRKAYGTPAVATSAPAAPAAAPAAAPSQDHLIHVPGRDQQTCLALTHNVIDLEFQRCIEGYDQKAPQQ